MPNMPRGKPRRRAHVSAYVETYVAQDLDDAADHHCISLSELVNRVLMKACQQGFPTDSIAFQKQYPKHHD